MLFAAAFIFGAVFAGLVFCIIFLNLRGKYLAQMAELQTKLDTQKEKIEDKSAFFDLIKKELNNYANEILIEKQKSLQEQNKISLEAFLNPLKEKIKEFQQKVEKADETGKINTATIKEKIEDLVRQNQLTNSATEKLSAAISNNSKFRGTLGEMILEKLLKASGLIDKKENPKNGNFETQVAFKDADGSSGNKILDAVIYLSEGNKCVVVDSKAPLSQFLNYTSCNNPDDAQKYLGAFMNDVYDRVHELSCKYTNLDGLQTPDFTIMFIPFEYPLTYIYSNNKLIEDALKQNVIIAGPSTLIATLRTISYLWAQKNQYDNIKEITKLAGSIYEKSIVFVQKIEGVQTSFETVKKKFDEVFKTAKGKGGLLGQVEKLKEFGLCPSSDIDFKYLEDEIPPLISNEK